MGGEILASDLTGLQKLAVFVNLLAGFNLAIGMFNLIPLLPLDGGHIAGGLWEGIKRGYAQVIRPEPFIDIAKVLPLTYALAFVMIIMAGLLVYADLINPLRLTGWPSRPRSSRRSARAAVGVAVVAGVLFEHVHLDPPQGDRLTVPPPLGEPVQRHAPGRLAGLRHLLPPLRGRLRPGGRPHLGELGQLEVQVRNVLTGERRRNQERSTAGSAVRGHQRQRRRRHRGQAQLLVAETLAPRHQGHRDAS